MLQLELGDWGFARAQAAPIREAVFVHEQGVPVEMEWDEFDSVSTHAIAWQGQGSQRFAVGTARLLPDGHIGRMAVLKAHRGQGIGAAMLKALLAAAAEKGMPRVVLHAQCHAEAFYRRFGFEAEGETFLEAGILHVLMTRTL